MHNEESSLSLLFKSPKLSEKVLYLFYSLLSGLFAFSFLFISIRSLTVIVNQAEFNIATFYLTITTFLVQVPSLLIASYGFMYRKSWIIPVVLTHIAITVLASVLLYTHGYTAVVMSTILNGSLLVPVLLVLFGTKKYLNASSSTAALLTTVAYSVFLLITVGIKLAYIF